MRKLRKDVLLEYSETLFQIGQTFFICNGNSFVEFQNLDLETYRRVLSDCGMTEERIEFTLRLDLFEQKVVDQKAVVQLNHRHVREYITSLYGSKTLSKLPVQTKQSRLKDSHLSVFRCILAQLQRSENKANLSERVVNVTMHFLESCPKANEWGIT